MGRKGCGGGTAGGSRRSQNEVTYNPVVPAFLQNMAAKERRENKSHMSENSAVHREESFNKEAELISHEQLDYLQRQGFNVIQDEFKPLNTTEGNALKKAPSKKENEDVGGLCCDTNCPTIEPAQGHPNSPSNDTELDFRRNPPSPGPAHCNQLSTPSMAKREREYSSKRKRTSDLLDKRNMKRLSFVHDDSEDESQVEDGDSNDAEVKLNKRLRSAN